MAYSEKLANRIREALADVHKVKEKQMMGGLTFMVNGKMCVGTIKDELMCRIDPTGHEVEIERQGCRTMDFTKKPLKGYIMIDDTGMKTKPNFDHWISLALEFNKRAKASRKKNKSC